MRTPGWLFSPGSVDLPFQGLIQVPPVKPAGRAIVDHLLAQGLPESEVGQGQRDMITSGWRQMPYLVMIGGVYLARGLQMQ
jgi:hypothetical protein